MLVLIFNFGTHTQRNINATINQKSIFNRKNYFYPDAIIDCSEDEQDYYTENPTLIVEVLSKSTRQKERP